MSDMVLVIVAVCVGAVLQRTAGMGFALVASPYLIIALGPLQGVVVANICQAVVALVMRAVTRADIEWPRLGPILLGSPMGALVGAALTSAVEVDWLYLTIGGLLTASLVGTLGVGAPPMTVYAELTRWRQRTFAASMQPIAVVIAGIGASVALLVPGATPDLSAAQWTGVGAALAVGAGIGMLVGPRTPTAPRGLPSSL